MGDAFDGEQGRPPFQIQAAAKQLIADAVKPILSNTEWRTRLLAIKRSYEQIIDTVSQDTVLEAGFSADAKEKAKSIVTSFREFIEQHIVISPIRRDPSTTTVIGWRWSLGQVEPR